MRKILAALGVWLALVSGAAAQTCSALPFTFTANTVIHASQVNSDFSSLLACANTQLAPLASPAFTGTITGASETLTGTLTLSNTPLAPASGGTNLATLTAHNLLVGNGTGSVLFLAPGSNGNIAISNGTDWASVAPGNGLATSGSTVAINSAAKSDMQTATSTSTVVTPAQTQNHPGVAKAWVQFTGSSGAINASYNVTSVTRNGTGDYTVNFTTNFSTANYAWSLSSGTTAGSSTLCDGPNSSAPTASAFRFSCFASNNFTQTDPGNVSAIFFGGQ